MNVAEYFRNLPISIKILQHVCRRIFMRICGICAANLFAFSNIVASDSRNLSRKFTNLENVIVETMESGVEHFIIYVYEYDIKPLGKCFYTSGY